MILYTNNASETTEIGRKIGMKLEGGETILLNGELGAGKTTFTKGLALSLGVENTILSPTFTIIKEYKGKTLYLYHIDMYRIEDESEQYELGIDECFSQNSVVVIEWNKLNTIQGKVITVNIAHLGDNKRKVEILGI